MSYQGLENSQHSFCASDTSVVESAVSSDSNLLAVNPDGTVMKATPAFKYTKKLQEDDKAGEQNNNNQILYIMDNEEVIFYADVNEIPAYFDDFVALFIKHQKNFKSFLIIAIISELLFQIINYYNKSDILEELQYLYPDTPTSSLINILNLSMLADTCFAAIFYTLGFVAIFRASTRLLGYFTTLAIAGLILEMALSYVTTFNFFVFLLRFIALIYGKFINQILVTLLMIPRVTQAHANA
mmetsp:Transcript_5500/g.5926  ORF Transcript_5500/g.5926 Transcript_5500/m.5926 type:complete len:241 (+) Transcript_5500:29-751(+)